MNYDWPGNVRVLENLVERELIRHRGGQLHFDTLLPPDREEEPFSRQEPNEVALPLPLDEAMTRHIENVLKITKGKVHGPGGAAELLAIKPNTLRARMDKLGIRFGRKRS